MRRVGILVVLEVQYLLRLTPRLQPPGNVRGRVVRWFSGGITREWYHQYRERGEGICVVDQAVEGILYSRNTYLILWMHSLVHRAHLIRLSGRPTPPETISPPGTCRAYGYTVLPLRCRPDNHHRRPGCCCPRRERLFGEGCTPRVLSAGAHIRCGTVATLSQSCGKAGERAEESGRAQIQCDSRPCRDFSCLEVGLSRSPPGDRATESWAWRRAVARETPGPVQHVSTTGTVNTSETARVDLTTIAT